jgi:DNA-binding protein HU-beta
MRSGKGHGERCGGQARKQPGRLMIYSIPRFWKMLEEIVDFNLSHWHHSRRSAGCPPPASKTQIQGIKPVYEQGRTRRVSSENTRQRDEQGKAERALEAVIEGIKGGLKKGKPVQLVGFGTFKVANRKARLGINPKTGEKIKIKASKSVKFSAGKDLKSKLGK